MTRKPFYPVPHNEEERLRALASYAVLDSAPESDFDHIVALASAIFSVPIALVSLVADTRQFFKARVGLDVCETSREVSFCTHAMATPEVMVVPDATKDPRFSWNPLVTDYPNIRFYAGAPLISPSGFALGSLCIIDDVPRHDFGPSNADMLARLAALVIDRLEMRRIDQQRQLKEQELVRTAYVDALTSLPNRVAMRERLDDRLRQNAAVTMMLIDLDGFKNVNDTQGHLKGDELLQQVAKRIRSVVSEAHYVARPSGDEFVILVDGDDLVEAETITKAILSSFQTPFELDRHAIKIGASMGVAVAPRDGRTGEELFSSADMALYRAKEDGRGSMSLFTPGLRSAALARRSLEDELNRAFERNEFELHYQPQIRMRDGSLAGAEALLRWRHPERGIIAPGAFVAVLEDMQIGAEIGEWTIRKACADFATLPEKFQIAVNLFGAQFRKGNLLNVVENALETSDLPAEQLELEITENIILEQHEFMASILQALRFRGVGIAFDDYGTGFASLSQIKMLPLTKLKIDKSFVQGLCTDRKDTSIVEAIMHLAHGFGFKVVAEGIEDLDQHDRLRALGCDKGQGYLYGRPMPIEEFAQRSKNWKAAA